jgi:hypothetical protein
MDPQNNQPPQPAALTDTSPTGDVNPQAPVEPITWEHGVGFTAPEQQPPSAATTPKLSDWEQPGEWTARGLPSTPVTSEPVIITKKSNKVKILAIIAVALALIVVAVTVYAILFKKEPEPKSPSKKTLGAVTVTARGLSTLNNAALNPLQYLNGYALQTSSTETVKNYISASGSCELKVATLPATELPGADINAIAATYLAQLKKSGATIFGPEPGLALLLKDQTGQAMYVMPTMNYELVQNKKHTAGHYSLAILTNNTRLLINRFCISDTPQLAAQKLLDADELAKTVTVKLNN